MHQILICGFIGLINAARNDWNMFKNARSRESLAEFDILLAVNRWVWGFVEGCAAWYIFTYSQGLGNYQ